VLETLREAVKHAWKEADLTAMPSLLTRLLQREVTSPKDVLMTATAGELQILLHYAETGQMPPMRC
jgi:hypothetical protein